MSIILRALQKPIKLQFVNWWCFASSTRKLVHILIKHTVRYVSFLCLIKLGREVSVYGETKLFFFLKLKPTTLVTKTTTVNSCRHIWLFSLCNSVINNSTEIKVAFYQPSPFIFNQIFILGIVHKAVILWSLPYLLTWAFHFSVHIQCNVRLIRTTVEKESF